MSGNLRRRIAIVFLAMGCLSSGGLFSPLRADETDSKLRPQAIKIATIGSLPAAVSAAATPDQILRHVKRHWQSRFEQVLPDRPDLIVVPENCDRPDGIRGERELAYYAVRGNQIRDFFAQVAKENHCYITYPAIRQLDEGTWRNSIVLLDRTGEEVGIYNKNHPTIGEIQQGKLPGTEVPVFQCDFGRVALVICFDLNFDRLRQQYVEADPDLILFCSNYHGGLMQAYWAYSCRSHFVGSIRRMAPSEIRNPLGNVVATTTDYFDFAVAEVNLDCESAHLDHNWDHFRALKEKYGPAVTITDPGLLGSVLVTSSHETIGVQAMIDEFGIERLDDYMDRALAERDKHTPSSESLQGTASANE